MEFIERSDHYLELKDDGTYTKHNAKFAHVGGQQIRIDIDPITKAETPSFIKVKNIIEVDKLTGDIKSIKRDFNPRREILGAEANADPLLENRIVEAVDYPSDMEDQATGAIKYKYNKVTGRLDRRIN